MKPTIRSSNSFEERRAPWFSETIDFTGPALSRELWEALGRPENRHTSKVYQNVNIGHF
jgi:hypothetical protein